MKKFSETCCATVTARLTFITTVATEAVSLEVDTLNHATAGVCLAIDGKLQTGSGGGRGGGGGGEGFTGETIVARSEAVFSYFIFGAISKQPFCWCVVGFDACAVTVMGVAGGEAVSCTGSAATAVCAIKTDAVAAVCDRRLARASA